MVQISFGEGLLMFGIMFMMIGMFAMTYAYKMTLNEYVKAYNECTGNFYKLQSGSYVEFWNVNLTGITNETNIK